MMPLEPVVLSFGAALLLGLGYGSGPCTLACLPFLGPVFTATEGGIREAWHTLLPFSLGRLSGYALLGGAAGGLGLLVEDWLAGPWVRWLLGIATLLVALSILRARSKAGVCPANRPPGSVAVAPPDTGGRGSPAFRNGRSLHGSLYLVGLGLALNPCAPLTTIMLASATSASIITGLTLGSSFALGAILLPSLVLAFGAAHFGQQVRRHLAQHHRALENASLALLIATGAATALGPVNTNPIGSVAPEKAPIQARGEKFDHLE